MSEAANGVEITGDKNKTDDPGDTLHSVLSNTSDATTEEEGTSKQCASMGDKETVKEAKEATKEPIKETTKESVKEPARNSSAKRNSVDFVVISDDEAESSHHRVSAINGSFSPNGVESVDSDNSDELDVIGDDDDNDEDDDESEDNADDEIEITGVSIANNEYGTVGGMDQLLRTLINQGWTETEIMSQLRGMIIPFQSRQRLSNFSTISDVVDRIKRVNKIIIVSGAGISVSCGIPDFRSETGLYARLSKEYPTLPNPTAMFDLSYFLDDPKPFFTFAKEIWPGQFKPSPCHRFIKLLESHGKLLRNYTQNIDTLEQVAGIENVIQCHGSFATASCIYCRFQVNGDDIKEDIMEGRAPRCPKCKELSLVEGKKTYLEFAKKKYREIKKKLRRREKFSSSSSSSSPSIADDDGAAMSSKQNGSNRLVSNDAIPSSCGDKPEESPDRPSSSKQVASVDEPMETNDQIDKSEGPSKTTTENEANSAEASQAHSRTGDKEVKDKLSDDQPTNSKDQSSTTRRKSLATVSNKFDDTVESSTDDDVGPPLDPILKPDIVFFGEDLPRNFFDHAEEDLEQAELIIVIGSSMKVKPVASIPEFVQERTPRVLINREPVRHISFDVQLLGDADEIVQQLCHDLEWESPVDEASSDKKRPHRPNVIPLEELSPLPTRQDIEGENASADSNKSKPGTSSQADVESGSKSDTLKDSGTEKQEFEEPCPLFGVRCRCPVSWNIARYLPDDTVAKMQPNTFIFPGANVMHPKHVFTTSNDLYTVESDSDLGGFDNPIEVSSSEGSVHSDEERVTELSDAENTVVSTSKSPTKSFDDDDDDVDMAVSSKSKPVDKLSGSDEKSSTGSLSPKEQSDKSDKPSKRPLEDVGECSKVTPSKQPRLSTATEPSKTDDSEPSDTQITESSSRDLTLKTNDSK